MGPNVNHLDNVKLDAHVSTLRHFENEMRDNEFKPVVALKEVDKIVRAALGKTEEMAPQVEAPAPAVEAAPEVAPAATEEAPKKESK